MDTRLLKSIKVYLLVLILMVSQPGVFAQKPPTGGPNPTKEKNLLPYIVAAGGVGLGTAARYFIKKRGPKVAVREHLPAYLLDRNILPTPDALNLMYKLNPQLNNVEYIRANQKLEDPEFPKLPESQFEQTRKTLRTLTSMPFELQEQVNVFKYNLNTFRRTKITIKADNKNMNIDLINDILKQVEKDIISQ